MPHENTSGEHHPIAAAFLFAVLLVWWVSTFYACLGYNNGYQSGLHTTTVIQSSVTEINCNGLDEYTYATVRNNTGTSQDVAAQYINETCKSACGNPIWIAAVISRDISGHECYYFWFDEHRPRAKRFAEALPVGYQETVAYGWLKDGCTVANKTDFVWWLISCSCIKNAGKHLALSAMTDRGKYGPGTAVGISLAAGALLVFVIYASLGYAFGYPNGLRTATVIHSSIIDVRCSNLDEYTYATVKNYTGLSWDDCTHCVNDYCRNVYGNTFWVGVVISRDASAHVCYFPLFDEHFSHARWYTTSLPVGYQHTVSYGWLTERCVEANKADIVWWIICCIMIALYAAVGAVICAVLFGKWMLHTPIWTQNYNRVSAFVQDKINSIMGRFKGSAQSK